MNFTISAVKKYKKQVILGPLFKIIEVIFELFMPLIMKYMIDTGYNEFLITNDYSKIIIPGLLILLICILGFSSTFVCQYFASIASQGYGTLLRNEIFKKTNELSLKEIEIFGKGHIFNLISADVNRLQVALAMIIRLVIRAPAVVIGSLIMSIIISPLASLIFLGVTILIFILIFVIFKISSKQIIKVQEKMDKISSIANDDLNGVRYIKGFNKEEFESKRFFDSNLEYYKESKINILINSLVNPLTFLIIDFASLGVVLLGNISFANTNLTKGDIISLIAYLNQILLALVVICNLVLIFTRAYASKNRIDKYLNTDSSIKNKEDSIIKKDFNDAIPLIEFKDVSFKYEEDSNYVVSNLNFKIYKGDNIGIIGSTGSGKTTLIKLLLRFFDASKGTIYYKGNDIKDYNLNELRDEIAIVLQKNQIFSGTIKENLCLSNKNIDENNMIHALKDSEAYDFVFKTNDKLDTYLNEGAKNLSGGQKQRLSIARSLLKNSEVLILDDSTSALDYLTDLKVRSNLKKKENLTTIIISQRISSLKGMNKILVMSKGTIEAIGQEEELLKTSKTFKEIYESQRNN